MSPGKKIGAYLQFDAFASGGMATVHLGRLDGDGGFSRIVALKRLRHFHEEEDRSRNASAELVEEVLLTSRLHHPNIVATRDVVVDEDEVVLVMDYVHGESLARLVRVTHERGERVPADVLDPRSAWADKAAYDRAAADLAGRFREVLAKHA